MERIWRVPILVALAMTLTGCPPPQYSIRAFADKSGQLWFDARFVGMWPFKWNDDSIEIERLEVVSSGSVLWAVEVDSQSSKCRTGRYDRKSRADIRYPIRYGELRSCFTQLVAPQKLPIGQKLIVRAEDFNNGFGEFSLEKPVILIPVVGDPFEESNTQEWPTAWPGLLIDPATLEPIANATDR